MSLGFCYDAIMATLLQHIMEYWFWELAHLYVHVTELAQASVFEPTLFTSHNSTEKQTQFSIFW